MRLRRRRWAVAIAERPDLPAHLFTRRVDAIRCHRAACRRFPDVTPILIRVDRGVRHVVR